MTVVLQMEPLWGTADSVTALYGIPRRRLLELARCGHIRARKLSPDSRSATIVFRTADVREWLENEAPTPRAEAFAPSRGPGVPRTGDDGWEASAEPSLAALACGYAGGTL
jgi:hypothetical protein